MIGVKAKTESYQIPSADIARSVSTIGLPLSKRDDLDACLDYISRLEGKLADKKNELYQLQQEQESFNESYMNEL